MTDYLLRVFASAIVRRIAFVLVACVLAWCGIGRAEAACTQAGSSNWTCATKTEAYAQVRWTGSDFCPVYGYPQGQESADYSENSGSGTSGSVLAKYKCTPPGTYVATATASWQTACPAGQQWNPSTFTCTAACSSRAEETNWLYDDDHQSVCHEGCSYDGGINVGGPNDGTATFTPNGNTCTVGPGNPPPVVDTDGDGVGDPDDDFPNDPGETTDTDGDGVGDNGDSDPNDPTNGGDDGGGDESDNTSTGGGNCATPPNSSGDGILTQIAFQAWKTRCAIEGVVDGGAVKTKVTNFPTTTGGGTDEPDVPFGEETAPDESLYKGDGGEGTADTVKTGNGFDESAEGYGSDGFDDSGFGWSRACPAPVTVDVFGRSISLAPANSVMCDWLNLGGYFVLLIAMLVSLRILMQA